MRRIGLTLRAGFSVRRLLMALAALVVVPLVAGALLPGHGQPDSSFIPLTCRVLRGRFLHQVSAKGTVESAENVEVPCDVSIDGFYRTKILQLAPEGSHVKRGDFLVRLDSAPLEEMRTEQQIACFTSEALLIQARKYLDKALAAKEEYFGGTYRQQKLNLDAGLLVAKEKYRRAQEYVVHSRKLYAQGYITQRELEADEFAARKAKIELDVATTRLNVLVKYKRKRMEIQLDGDVITSRARLRGAQSRHDRNLERLADLDEQIKKCLITAPNSGQVVYAHLHHHGHSHMIEEGAEVFRGQILVRLPDPTQMQVVAKIREDSVALVEKGMPVRVELEAYPGAPLTGRVSRVSQYPEPNNFFGPSVKEFEATIALDDSGLDLRPGLTAEVKICVEDLSDQLFLPAQAVLKHGSKNYCLTCDDGCWQAHEVQTGACDGKYVVIRDGIDEGSRVVLGSGSYRTKVDLPALDDQGDQG